MRWRGRSALRHRSADIIRMLIGAARRPSCGFIGQILRQASLPPDLPLIRRALGKKEQPMCTIKKRGKGIRARVQDNATLRADIDLNKLLKAALIIRFERQDNIALINIESWVPEHVCFELAFRQSTPPKIEVFEKGKSDMPALPWDVIGFDAFITEQLEWQFVLTCNEHQISFRSNWPTLERVRPIGNEKDKSFDSGR